MELALPSTLLHQASSDGFFVFVLRFWTWLGRQRSRTAAAGASTEDPSALVLKAVHRFGGVLLAAEDADDLDARIDQVLDEEDFHGIVVRMTEWTFNELQSVKTIEETASFAAAPFDSQLEADLIRVLGPASKSWVYQGLRCMQVVGHVWSAFMHRYMPDGLPVSPEEAQAVASQLAYDPDTHPAISRGLVSGQRMNAVLFAMLEALVRDFYLEPWLGIALAERFLYSTRGYLRLLASGVPDVEVPEDLLPREERLPMDVLQAESKRAHDSFRQLIEQAERSGEPLYPPGE